MGSIVMRYSKDQPTKSTNALTGEVHDVVWITVITRTEVGKKRNLNKDDSA